MLFKSKILALSAFGGVLLFAGPSNATALGDPPTTQPSIEEDFAYPGAEEKRGIRLHRGDGRILLADCGSSPDLLEIRRNDLEHDKFCFEVKGGKGYLTLEVSNVYFIVGGKHAVKAKVTEGDEKKEVQVPPDQWVPVGAGNPNFATLVELRVPA